MTLSPISTTTNTRGSKAKGLLKDVEALIDRLATSAVSARDSQEFQDWLRVVSRFHQYSFNNTLLIYRAMPTATRVAGYKTWQKLGRQVKRGEKGIPILAPVVYRKKPEPTTKHNLNKLESEEDQEDQEEVRIGFRVVHVFDISQTEGDPLPTLDHTLNGDDSDLLELATRTATSFGYNVFTETLPDGVNGVARPPREILVSKALPPQGRAKTIFHELAHHLLRHCSINHNQDKHLKELAAEASAFVTLHYLGVDSELPSSRYVATWMKDKDNLKTVLVAVHETVKKILDSIEEVR